MRKEITRNDVEEALEVGTTQAVNTLKEMLSKDLIKIVGSGRLTRYIIKWVFIKTISSTALYCYKNGGHVSVYKARLDGRIDNECWEVNIVKACI